MMLTEWTLFSVVIALLHCCGAAAAAHAIVTVRSAQSATAWSLSLLLLPYLTLVPYFLFGRSRLTRNLNMQSFYEARAQPLSKHQRPALQRLSLPHHWRSDIDLESYKVNPKNQRMQAVIKMTRAPLLGENSVRLLIDGQQTFDALFSAISTAKKLIILQSFAVHHDQLGYELQALLCARATEGVVVYFLYDSIGSHHLPRSYIDTLRHHGVHAQSFSTSRSFRNPLQINFRNHRKLAVIDGHTAFLGGLNIGDPYLGKTPRLSPWRDTHVVVSGPVVANLQMLFAEDWFWMTQTLPALTFPKPCTSHHMHCQVLASGPADAQETCLLFFVEAINSARKRIWLTSPYFVPDDAIRVALELAVLRGVDVRLLLPGCADHRTVFAASSLHAYEIMRAGVKVYRYQPGFMHQKVVLIDEDMAAIGSANLDNRSFRLNFELMLITIDTEFARSVETMLKNDFSQSTLISILEYRNVSSVKKFAMHFAKLFSPIL